MKTDQLIQEAQKLTKDIVFPNQPRIILALDKELQKSEANFKSISNLISKDVALSAKVLKIANAPFWGIKKKVDTIERALFVLGLKNFKNIVLTTCLQEIFQSDPKSNENFIAFNNHSIAVAGVAKYFSGHIKFEEAYRIDQEVAYLVGLFHDCGMMLMAKKFDDYLDNCLLSLSDGTNIIDMEHRKYNMNHPMVSCMLINKWEFSQLLIEPILYHHDPSIERHKNIYLKQLAAILKMAEHIVSYAPVKNKYEQIFHYHINEEKSLEEIKSFMNIDDEEYQFLQDKILDLIAAFTI